MIFTLYLYIYIWREDLPEIEKNQKGFESIITTKGNGTQYFSVEQPLVENLNKAGIAIGYETENRRQPKNAISSAK